MMQWTDLLLFGPPVVIAGGCWLTALWVTRAHPGPAKAMPVAIVAGRFPHRRNAAVAHRTAAE